MELETRSCSFLRLDGMSEICKGGLVFREDAQRGKANLGVLG